MLPKTITWIIIIATLLSPTSFKNFHVHSLNAWPNCCPLKNADSHAFAIYLFSVDEADICDVRGNRHQQQSGRTPGTPIPYHSRLTVNFKCRKSAGISQSASASLSTFCLEVLYGFISGKANRLAEKKPANNSNFV